MLKQILQLLFPQKCVLCRKVLSARETDLCHSCRKTAPEFKFPKKNISFVAGWTAVWYYKGQVRESLHRFKFYNARSNGDVYGRLLAMRLLQEDKTDFDVLTWVPLSPLRRFRRGYDQGQLLAQAVGRALNRPATSTLRKHRHTPPQSNIQDSAARRANVLGAYRAVHPENIQGKRILLMDDIITTGATISECARVLLTAGAKEVICAAVAATEHKG